MRNLPPVTDRSEDGEPDLPFISRAAMPLLVADLVEWIMEQDMPTETVFAWDLGDLENALAAIRREEYPALEELLNATCARLLAERIEQRQEMEWELAQMGDTRCPVRE